MRELFVATAGGATPQPLVVGSNARGRDVALEGSARSIKLLARASNPAPGAPAWLPLGEISLPEGRASHYLLVLAAAQGAASVRGVAVADDTEAFPVGTVRLANFINSPLLAKVGEKAARHAPGFSAPISYAVTAPANATAVPSFPFALATEVRLFFNGRIDAWPGSRTLVFVVPSSAAGKDPMVKSIIDRPPPAAK